MISKKSRLQLRKFHKYAGIILGLQLLFWIVSGIYFSWVPLETVRGRDLASEKERLPLDLPHIKSLQEITELQSYPVFEIRLINTYNSRPVYKIKSDRGYLYFDAISGDQRMLLTKEEISQIARNDYRHHIKVAEINLFEEKAPQEYKGDLPVYRVSFDDLRATNLYLHPISGEILARRNHYWRIFDFLWMLHILDFGDREDFNNFALRAISLLSLSIVLSGYGIALTVKLRRKT